MTEYQITSNYTSILDKEIKKKKKYQVIYFQLSKNRSELIIVRQEALKTLREKEKNNVIGNRHFLPHPQ